MALPTDEASEEAALPRGGLRGALSRATELWRSALRDAHVQELREAYASYRFRGKTGPGDHFFRTFATLAEAEAALPLALPTNFDTTAAATLYRDRLDHIESHDYPALFWLKPLVKSARRVFDLGGHVGISHYAYERYLGPLWHLDWLVCDLPAVVEMGRELAAARGRRGLHFTTESRDASGADMLLASDVLPYMKPGYLPWLLATLSAPPKHVLLNVVPTTNGESFFTLHHIHTGICTYAVFNEQELVQGIVRAGYELVDSWSVPEKQLHIPGHPERGLDAYRGFYFRKTA